MEGIEIHSLVWEFKWEGMKWVRPVQEYTGIDKTDLTAPPHPTQSSAEGFQYGGRRWIFNTDVGLVRPSALRFAHRRRPNQPDMFYIYVNMYKKS